MVIVLMGPMGCGKTTIGSMLSSQMGWLFYDADDYHPQVNKEKMERGIPLDDKDRMPWLEILRSIIEENLANGKDMVLACSALKKKYRSQLGIDQQKTHSVYLKGSSTLLQERLAARSHEYMAAELLQSQLDILEEPETGITVDISLTPEEICRIIVAKIVAR